MLKALTNKAGFSQNLHPVHLKYLKVADSTEHTVSGTEISGMLLFGGADNDKKRSVCVECRHNFNDWIAQPIM